MAHFEWVHFSLVAAAHSFWSTTQRLAASSALSESFLISFLKAPGPFGPSFSLLNRFSFSLYAAIPQLENSG
jgi:hypothetical protein